MHLCMRCVSRVRVCACVCLKETERRARETVCVRVCACMHVCVRLVCVCICMFYATTATSLQSLKGYQESISSQGIIQHKISYYHLHKNLPCHVRVLA